jgi:hypothetical protein
VFALNHFAVCQPCPHDDVGRLDVKHPDLQLLTIQLGHDGIHAVARRHLVYEVKRVSQFSWRPQVR